MLFNIIGIIGLWWALRFVPKVVYVTVNKMKLEGILADFIAIGFSVFVFFVFLM